MIRQRYETKCVKLSEEPTSSASQKIFKELEVESWRVVNVVYGMGIFTVIATRAIETPCETREISFKPPLGGLAATVAMHIRTQLLEGWEHVDTQVPADCAYEQECKLLFIRRPVG